VYLQLIPAKADVKISCPAVSFLGKDLLRLEVREYSWKKDHLGWGNPPGEEISLFQRRKSFSREETYGF
jgi:hypothetical protein